MIIIKTTQDTLSINKIMRIYHNEVESVSIICEDKLVDTLSRIALICYDFGKIDMKAIIAEPSIN